MTLITAERGDGNAHFPRTGEIPRHVPTCGFPPPLCTDWLGISQRLSPLTDFAEKKVSTPINALRANPAFKSL